MGALNPLFLVAGLAVGVPLFLHLFHRQEARRLAFPALRYLERTEKEHARRIKLRQLILLLLRVGVVLMVVGAGARLFLRGPGAAHPPTALVIVLDNSMSSGLVVGDERVLDQLKAVALATLDQATEDDRVWVVLAGEPWAPAVPGTPAQARVTVLDAAVSAARGDLTAALQRAAELASTSDLPAREIHLLSDLQATAFQEGENAPARQVPVVVWAPANDPVTNRALAGVVVGGGLPPLEGQRSEIAIQAASLPGSDTTPVPVRVVMDERVRGAGMLPAGASLVLPLPAAPPGWIVGYADADPDALRADDRRYFAFRARPAPAVAVAGDVGLFVQEALAVLEAGARVRQAPVQRADALLSGAGEGLDAAGVGAAVLVIPPADPTQLPALNRRLQGAGIPWRFERNETEGTARLDGDAAPEALSRLEVHWSYHLRLDGDPPSPPRSLAYVGGDPWAVEGRTGTGARYLLLASPLDATSTGLPTSAEMIGFLDWVTSGWAASGTGSSARVAVEALSAPRGAEAVRFPSGLEVTVDGTRMVRATGEVGVYAFLAGDSTVAFEAVNTHPAESDLRALDGDLLQAAVGPAATRVRRLSGWSRAIFVARRGPELWRSLVLAALLVLLVEAAIAATGGPRRARGEAGPGEAARVRP